MEFLETPSGRVFLPDKKGVITSVFSAFLLRVCFQLTGAFGAYFSANNYILGLW